jgi:hypothetical protein
MRCLSPKLLDVLRGSLQRVQAAIEVDPPDPALQRLKSSILRSISELEIKKSQDTGHTAHPHRHTRVVQIHSRPRQHQADHTDSTQSETDAA